MSFTPNFPPSELDSVCSPFEIDSERSEFTKERDPPLGSYPQRPFYYYLVLDLEPDCSDEAIQEVCRQYFAIKNLVDDSTPESSAPPDYLDAPEEPHSSDEIEMPDDNMWSVTRVSKYAKKRKMANSIVRWNGRSWETEIQLHRATPASASTNHLSENILIEEALSVLVNPESRKAYDRESELVRSEREKRLLAEMQRQDAEKAERLRQENLRQVHEARGQIVETLTDWKGNLDRAISKVQGESTGLQTLQELEDYKRLLDGCPWPLQFTEVS